jgi:putative nucleotidyltransferase with HDIG domain
MPKAIFQLADGTKVTKETDDERHEREIQEFSIKAFVEELKEDLRSNKLVLPTLPSVAVESLMIINDIGSSASDLVRVISKDTSITARLIRYANSPLYHGMPPITAIKQAVTRIGFDKVRHAVYSVSMQEVFQTQIKEIEKRMQELWTHSVKVAAHAATLAKTHGLDSDVALVAGLVHDIGKIPLYIKACEYEELVNRPEYLDRLVEKLHTKLGGSILKLWKFDPEVIRAAAEHNDLERTPGDAPLDYVDLIQVANIMSYEGTDHPLAKVDIAKVAAFARLNANKRDEDGTVEERVAGVTEVFF